MRQWVPQTQQHIEILIEEILKRGGRIDDRDGLTDMTLLHYAAKSGAIGVGDIKTSCKVVKKLISLGANLIAKCRWTDMSALHYAVFFDIKPVVKILLDTGNIHGIYKFYFKVIFNDSFYQKYYFNVTKNCGILLYLRL